MLKGVEFFFLSIMCNYYYVSSAISSIILSGAWIYASLTSTINRGLISNLCYCFIFIVILYIYIIYVFYYSTNFGIFNITVTSWLSPN
jgi:hypothetical protein